MITTDGSLGLMEAFGYKLTFEVMGRADGRDAPITEYTMRKVIDTIEFHCTFHPTVEEVLSMVDDYVRLNAYNRNRIRRKEYVLKQFSFYTKK